MMKSADFLPFLYHCELCLSVFVCLCQCAIASLCVFVYTLLLVCASVSECLFVCTDTLVCMSLCVRLLNEEEWRKVKHDLSTGRLKTDEVR